MCACVGVYEQCMRVCAYVCAHAQNASERARARARVRVRAERRAARDGDVSSREHSSHVYYDIYACAHVHRYACARRMHPSVRARARARARARRERGRPLIVCHFVPFI